MDTYFSPPLLRLLSSELIAQLSAAGQEKQFTDGQMIHSRGGGQPGLSIIMAGRVRFGIYDEDGGYIQTGLLSEGHCFGEATLFADQQRAYDAEAIGETVVLGVSKGRFNKLLEDSPGFSRGLLVTLTGRLYDALAFADDLRGHSVEARVARQLLRLNAAGNFPEDIVPIRQIDLAYSLGLSRVSVGKALEKLQMHGTLELGYRQIRIIDRASLANTA